MEGNEIKETLETIQDEIQRLEEELLRTEVNINTTQ